MFKRYEVQGPFRRKTGQYWIVFDKIGKQVVLTRPRSGECWNEMSRLEAEHQQKATSTGE